MSAYPCLRKTVVQPLLSIIIPVALFTNSPLIYAQGAGALEEIVVTAQRREQSLQDVPISVQVFTGDMIMKEGFRSMEDIENFSPSVEINESLHEQSITIRGVGNDAANLSIEQSAPVFLDGVVFTRGSMIQAAFLDVERVEVLKGPQPVYFGQNTIAGAFSIISKKPTPQWEGDFTAEVGNFGTKTFEGGVGGPITDTLGIRVAGQWDRIEGHITDIFSGEKFPRETNKGGRVTLEWTPMDNFSALFKAEWWARRSGGDTNVLCRSGTPGDPASGEDFVERGESIVLERGQVDAYDAVFNQRPLPACDGEFGNVGIREGREFPLSPVPGINNIDNRSGIIDIVDIAPTIIPEGNLKPREPIDSWNYRLGLNYELNNGMLLESTTAFIDYERETFESTDESPILNEAAWRGEDYNMWSQEIRLSSPASGIDLGNNMNLEFAVGGYWQKEDLDLPVVTVRGNTRREVRKQFHQGTDAEWLSAFASFTLNIGERISLDVGGRYSDVSKHGTINASGAKWIFDVDPDPNDDGIIEATEHRGDGPDVVRQLTFVNDDPDDGTIVDCGRGGYRQALDYESGGFSRNFCGPYTGMDGFYTSIWRQQDTPDPWDTMAPVDVSPDLIGVRNRPGPFDDTLSESSFDPQVVLRYRPFDNMALYAKWVRAFKAGGFDTSDRGLPDGGIGLEGGQEAFSFLQENTENWELGAKGTLFDRTFRYDVVLFNQITKDLQVETEIADLEAFLSSGVEETGRGQTNAGKVRSRGVEFNLTWLPHPRVLAQLGGLYQDASVLEFVGGCTEEELANAETTGCFNAEESIEAVDSEALVGLIDRAGFQLPRAPDWKFILGLDYWHPVLDDYKVSFSNQVAFSDGFTEDTLGFSQEIAFDKHINWNVNAGFGPRDDTWRVGFYARNILEATKSFFPGRDVRPDGVEEDDLPAGDFLQYGLQFQYSYR